MRFSPLSVACALLGGIFTTPAMAQDAEPASPVTISGSVTLASDYRFRGVSQTDKEMALQGGLTIEHESGFYIGTWGSNLAGWGTFGGANIELDLIAGYKGEFEGGAFDVGVTWFTYPGGFDETDVVELYGRLSGTAGPASLTAGVYYAPRQTSLGFVTASLNPPIAGTGRREDNLYLAGDATVEIPESPITLKAHIGHSDGNPGLGPNGTSMAPTGKYWDWSLGADVTFRNLTLGLAYIDTDLTPAETAYIQPSFSKSTDGSQIAGGTLLVSLTAAF